MDTDFSSGPLNYSSAEFKRIPLSTRILFFWTRISRIKRIFPSGSLDYSIRTVNPSVCQKHSCYSRNSCSKKSVFICVYPCAKNIRFVFKENPCSKKQSAQVPHTNAEPRRTTFILSVMPGDYHSRLPTRPLPLLLYITSQPSCHSPKHNSK